MPNINSYDTDINHRFPKIFKQALLALVLVSALTGLYSMRSLPAAEAAAGACQPSAPYGTATLGSGNPKRVSVSSAGTYTIWVRLQTAAAANNSVGLQVD